MTAPNNSATEIAAKLRRYANDLWVDGKCVLHESDLRKAADTISALHSANEKLRGECEELRGIATRAVALAEQGLDLVDLQQLRHKEISDKTDSLIDKYEAEAAARAANGDKQ